MKELKCPNCQHVFTVDAEMFESIAGQVRNAAFDDEVERRVAELKARMSAESEIARMKDRQSHNEALSKSEAALKERDAEIVRLRQQIESSGTAFEARLDAEIAKIRSGHLQDLSEKDREIQSLKASVDKSDEVRRVAVLEEKERVARVIGDKDSEIAELRNRVDAERKEAALREAALKEQHSVVLREKDAAIEFYKDMKVRLSTKMIGESLEVHCANEFNRVRGYAYPNAYFEKDNDSRLGSKGDFIFRDYADGMEYISIMFEMKNEADLTATKHRNEDFFAKLHKDRTEKKCEYAVLVSMLEPDNDFYNDGIVDVSHRYPKMFVVRPQFFMPVIALLSQASRKSIGYMRELDAARRQSLDVSNFEERLDAFRTAFGRNYRIASEKFRTAIEEIDKSISHLQKIKEALIGSENQLRLAGDKAEDLTIKKLTRGNPTMKAKFDAARAASDETGDDEL